MDDDREMDTRVTSELAEAIDNLSDADFDFVNDLIRRLTRESAEAIYNNEPYLKDA